MRIALLTFLAASFAATTFAETRRWSDATGNYSIEAEFITASNDSVVIQKTDGKFVVLPLAKLSKQDQQFARSANAGNNGAPANAPASVGTSGLKVTGQGVSDTQKNQFAKSFLTGLSIDLQPIGDKTLSGVVDVKLFKAKVTQKTSSIAMSSDATFVYDGKSFSSLQQPTTNQDFSSLLDLVSDDFKLTDQAAADRFEAMLDVLYPIVRFGQKKETKEIRQEGAKWLFIRGEFFDDLKGFIVSTSADGTITKIDYSLKIKRS